ncbi:MAG: CAP domain-containing protein [Patescibacteria group bacterium]|jgi:hypothetical protein
MFRFLQHLFVPHESNDFKAKYLHHDFLTGLIAVLILLNLTFKIAFKNFNNNILGVSTNISVDVLLNDTNAERAKNGLEPLTLNQKLNLAANDKAIDMFQENYWAHFSPTGTSPWFFFEKENYHYLYAGENLAKDFTDSQAVVTAWMNSPKHRENILKPEYTEIGFSIQEGTLLGQPTVLVVQLFGKQDPSFMTSDTTNPSAETKPVLAKQTVKNKSVTTQQVAGSVYKKPLIDIGILQKQIMFIVLMGFIFVLAIDLYYMEKQGAFRLSGKHVAHFIFIAFFLLGILTMSSGLIL